PAARFTGGRGGGARGLPENHAGRSPQIRQNKRLDRHLVIVARGSTRRASSRAACALRHASTRARGASIAALPFSGGAPRHGACVGTDGTPKRNEPCGGVGLMRSS